MGKGEFSYADLLAWAKERLPAWQQDALRRLVDNPILSSDDLVELAALALAPHTPGSSTATPIPLPEEKQLAPDVHPRVQLASVRKIERVNALFSGPVTFELQGLTVAYGGNASGKSGIARILKKACYARDPGGNVLPNVFESDVGQPASATIDFVVDGEKQTHDWMDGRTTDPLLRRVHVFDSRCATVQIEKPNLISYTPGILQIFRSLALATESVERILKSQKKALGKPVSSIVKLALDRDTPTGKFVDTLSERSDVDDLNELCDLTSAEKERIHELDRALTNDPLNRAAAEDARARRVQGLVKAISSGTRLISDEGCSALERLLKERDSSRDAAVISRNAFAMHSDLSGIGSETWRVLWESARAYSESHAYFGEAFPVVRKDAVCVLCQQELTTDASSRLHSFEEFVKADVQQRADKAVGAVENAIHGVRSLSLPRSVRRDLREANLLQSVRGEAARRFLVAAKLRRRQLLTLAEGRIARSRPPLPSAPDLVAVQRSI